MMTQQTFLQSSIKLRANICSGFIILAFSVVLGHFDRIQITHDGSPLMFPKFLKQQNISGWEDIGYEK